MDYKVLFETQKNFVDLVNKSVLKNRLSQVYLLNGEKGTPKLHGAMYLVNIILCGEVCSRCSDCLNLKEMTHPDVFKISPSGNYIKKEQIEELEKEFNLTSLKKRFVIIENIEKATSSASNSLLKFLEEMKENTYAILTTDNISRTLSTITSRSLIINFEKINKNTLFDFYISKGLDDELSRVLSNITNDVNVGTSLSCDNLFLKLLDFVRIINKCILLDENLFLLFNEMKFIINEQDKKYHELFLDLLIFITNSRLYYLIGKEELIIFKETIDEVLSLGIDINNISFEKTFKQVETMLEFKNKLLYNVNIELMYMDLFIKIKR